jgi:hypothetical protein
MAADPAPDPPPPPQAIRNNNSSEAKLSEILEFIGILPKAFMSRL